MRTEVAVDVAAGPEYVWAVLTDVARWPTWTSAVREVTLLDASALRPGGVLRVRAAGLPDRTWRVTDWSPGRAFTWTGDGLGCRATLRVRVRSVDGVTRVALVHERVGWLGDVVTRATRTTTGRHLHALADDLQARCQQKRPSAPTAQRAGEKVSRAV